MSETKITPCQCQLPEDGSAAVYCQRHGIYKTKHLVELCRTRPACFQLWEEGRGPGQKAASGSGGRPANHAGAPRPRPPSLHRQAWNLVRSLADFVADGCKTSTPEEYRRRLETCDACDQREGNRCMKCGCRLSLKAGGRAFKCPLDKWDS